MDSCSLSASSSGSFFFSGKPPTLCCYALHVIAVKRAIVIPDGPGDPHEFVGESDGGLVAMACFRSPLRPCLELRHRFAGMVGSASGIECGTRPVHEEHS